MVTFSEEFFNTLVFSANIELLSKDSRHLKWLMQKDLLGQDVFIIGVPGANRLSLILSYCELINREVEYLPLTRDTTENDIKQRRELHSGSAFYADLVRSLIVMY
jgi:hypothetical protein